jgi:hypothetical protein
MAFQGLTPAPPFSGAFRRDYGAGATAQGPVLPYAQGMDQQEILRRIAEANRLLVESRRTVDRQREVVARLERIGVNTAKQQALLSILLGAQADREERLAELLRWLESQLDQTPVGPAINAEVERERLDSQSSDAKARLSQYIDSQR